MNLRIDLLREDNTILDSLYIDSPNVVFDICQIEEICATFEESCGYVDGVVHSVRFTIQLEKK